MNAAGFRRGDEHYQFAEAAYNAVHALSVEVHYLGVQERRGEPAEGASPRRHGNHRGGCLSVGDKRLDYSLGTQADIFWDRGSRRFVAE